MFRLLILFVVLLLPQIALAQITLTPVTQGTASKTLAWDYAGSGSAIDDFLIEVSSEESGPWSTQAIVPKTTLTYVFSTSALTVGTKKYFRVYARKGQANPIPDDLFGPTNSVGLEIVSAAPLPSNLRFVMLLLHDRPRLS